MNTDKIINEFQNINSKLSTYENERIALQLKLKELDKEIKKLNDKIKKETDVVLKSLYKSKIVANQYFIDEINKIFSFQAENYKKVK